MCRNYIPAQPKSDIWCCANRLPVVELPIERKAPNLPQISPETRSGSTPDRSGRREATSRKYRRVQSECAYAPKNKGFRIYCTYGAVPKPRDRGVKRGKTSRRAWSSPSCPLAMDIVVIIYDSTHGCTQIQSLKPRAGLAQFQTPKPPRRFGAKPKPPRAGLRKNPPPCRQGGF